jgi:2'-5' RNA ligase
VESGERIRLFCALDLPDDARGKVSAWAAGSLASHGRLVPAENLPVTLACLGHRPAGEVPAILDELRAASAAAQPVELRPLRYRQTRGVRRVVLAYAGGGASALAGVRN